MIGHTKATTLVGLCVLAAALPGLTKAQTYSVIPIPLPSGTFFQSVSGVNSSNQVTGYVFVVGMGGFGFQAFLGTTSGSTLIPFPPGWSFDTYGNGLNNAGQVAGSSDTQTQAFIGALSGSTAIPLPAEWDFAQAYAINNANPVQVTGGGSSEGIPLAFIGTASILTAITPPLGWSYLYAGFGINDFGQVVGWGYTGAIDQAFFYNGESAVPIPVPEGSLNSYGMCVNSSGEVAGNGDTTAFVGNITGTSAIPLPAGATTASVSEGCINDFGAVVGTSDVGGWIWDPVNGTQILNNLVAPGHDILIAYSINNAGVILACDGEDCISDGPVLLFPGGAPAIDAGYQVKYAANLSIGESYIDIQNTAANGDPPLGPGTGLGLANATAGNLCANVYAIDPNEELVSCCSCLITPGATVNLGANADLANASVTATGSAPPSISIKLLASLAGTGGTGTSCANSAALSSNSSTAFPLAANGMAAWGTTLHQGVGLGPYVATETAFTPATLSTAELTALTGRCASITGNLSGHGQCISCQPGALGALKK